MAKPRATGPAKGVAVPPRPRKPSTQIKPSRKADNEGGDATARERKRRRRREVDTKDPIEKSKKRRLTHEQAEDAELAEDADERGRGYQTITKRVRLAKVKRQWRPLSATSQESFRALVGDATSAALSFAPRGRVSSNLQKSLELLNLRLSKILPKIRAPPSAASGFAVSKGSELEIPNADGLAAKIAELEELVEGERRIVNKLKTFVDEESRLLQGEKRELADFTKKRKAVERDEIKELTNKIHPALQKLYAADMDQLSTSTPLGTSSQRRVSYRWASEATSKHKVVDMLVRPPLSADDEEVEGERDAYDPLEDPLLKSLARQAMPTLIGAEAQITAIAHELQAAVRSSQTA